MEYVAEIAILLDEIAQTKEIINKTLDQLSNTVKQLEYSKVEPVGIKAYLQPHDFYSDIFLIKFVENHEPIGYIAKNVDRSKYTATILIKLYGEVRLKYFTIFELNDIENYIKRIFDELCLTIIN